MMHDVHFHAHSVQSIPLHPWKELCCKKWRVRKTTSHARLRKQIPQAESICALCKQTLQPRERGVGRNVSRFVGRRHDPSILVLFIDVLVHAHVFPLPCVSKLGCRGQSRRRLCCTFRGAQVEGKLTKDQRRLLPWKSHRFHWDFPSFADCSPFFNGLTRSGLGNLRSFSQQIIIYRYL